MAWAIFSLSSSASSVFLSLLDHCEPAGTHIPYPRYTKDGGESSQPWVQALTADTVWRKSKYIRNDECIWVSSNEADAPRAYYTEWSKSEREKQIEYINVFTWNPARWLLMNLSAGQQWRHRHTQQTCGHIGEGEGGRMESSTETHTSPHAKWRASGNSLCGAELKLGALWQPREVGQGGEWQGAAIYMPKADSCWCMAETNTTL